MRSIVYLLRLIGIGRIKAPSSPGPGDEIDESGLFTKFVIKTNDGRPYLTRWYLFRCPWFKMYLHQIHLSDQDRFLHDHPWKFVSFLLRGPGYYEYQPDGAVKFFPPWSINHRFDQKSPHRLEVKSNRPQWTFLVVGNRTRDWGFHVSNSMVDCSPKTMVGEPSEYVEDAIYVDHTQFLDNKRGVGNWTKEPGYEVEAK